MIVDFEQDPDAPFGTGNFRDDKGRQMYVSDPETASQFTKTMRGSGLGRQVAAESNDIATGIMGGNPNAGPGQRLASNEQKYQAAAAGLAGGAATATDAPTGAGASLVQKQADADAALKSPAPTPGAADTGTANYETALAPDEESAYQVWKQKYAPADSGADYDYRGAFKAGVTPDASGHWPDTFKKPNHPTFSNESQYASAAPDQAGQWVDGKFVPPSAGGRGAELVAQNDDVNRRLRIRTQERELPTPMDVRRNKLPPLNTNFGETVNVSQGRPVENVIEQYRDEAADFTARRAGTVRSYDERIAGAEASFGRRQQAVKADDVTQRRRQVEARRDRARAEAEQTRLNRALEENDKALDPDRTMRNMSTGKTIAMVILAALNGGFGAIIGKKDNDVLNVMKTAVDQDIDRQKQEIASGRIRIGNLIKKFQDEGFDAKQAERLARDALEKNAIAFADLEAQRIGATAEMRAQKDLALSQLDTEWTRRRGDLLKEAEDKVARARHAEESYGVPISGVTPQQQVAQAQLQNLLTEQENTKPVEKAVGHPVSPDEAREIKRDSQDYGKRLGTLATFRSTLKALATTLGLTYTEKDGFTGSADPGNRPLGIEAFRGEQARRIDRQYALIQRADIMGMVREPSARLQERFGEITERPFWDSDIPTQLNDLNDWANQAEGELRNGFSDDAINYYDRRGRPSSGGGRPTPPTPPPANGDNLGVMPLPSAGATRAPAPPTPAAPAAPTPPPAPAPPPAEQKKRSAVDARWE